jgi:hypothetical protein
MAYQWPHVPAPSRKEKERWTVSLGQVYGNTPSNPSLECGNYRWYRADCVEKTEWNFDLEGNKIYQKSGSHWLQWNPSGGNRRVTRGSATYTISGATVNIANQRWRPITIRWSGVSKISIKCKGRYHISEENEETPDTWYSPLLSTIDDASENFFMEQVRSRRGLVVGDGSYKNGRSSAAIVVQHQRTRNIDTGKKNTQSVTVPGHAKEQSSYRGELGGILTAIVYTNKKCKENNITEGKCIMGCDNKGALAASFGWKTPNPNWVCFDIVSMIRYHIRDSPIHWKGQHIKGHQDDSDQFEKLTEEAQANVIADKEAKAELGKGKIPIQNKNNKGQPWIVQCQGQLITGNVEARLRYVMQEEKAKEWWVKKLKIVEAVQNNISWDVNEGFRNLTPQWRNTWSVKYGAGILPTRKNLVIRGHGDIQSCPCCGAASEDVEHLFICPNAEIQKTFEEYFDKIHDFLRATTSPQIRENLEKVMQHLRTGTTPVTPDDSGSDSDSDSEWDTIVQQQLLIGQKGTLNGMWLNTWKEAQEVYLRRTKSRKSSRVWMIRLCIMIQDMTHGMWKTRNEAIHNNEDSESNKKQHEELDQEITNIFRDLPYLRWMPSSDAAFFKRKKEKVKRYRLKRKELWVTEATQILNAFTDSLDATSDAFINYFPPRLPATA